MKCSEAAIKRLIVFAIIFMWTARNNLKCFAIFISIFVSVFLTMQVGKGSNEMLRRQTQSKFINSKKQLLLKICCSAGFERHKTALVGEQKIPMTLCSHKGPKSLGNWKLWHVEACGTLVGRGLCGSSLAYLRKIIFNYFTDRTTAFLLRVLGAARRSFYFRGAFKAIKVFKITRLEASDAYK